VARGRGAVAHPDPNKTALLGDRIGSDARARGDAAVAAGHLDADAVSVEHQSMVAANQPGLGNLTQRERRAAMTAPVFERRHFAGPGVAKEHDGLAQ
jgi:hypothetical protein